MYFHPKMAWLPATYDVISHFQLCTQIWVRATIGQLKKVFVLFVVIARQVEGKFETHFQ